MVVDRQLLVNSGAIPRIDSEEADILDLSLFRLLECNRVTERPLPQVRPVSPHSGKHDFACAVVARDL